MSLADDCVQALRSESEQRCCSQGLQSGGHRTARRVDAKTRRGKKNKGRGTWASVQTSSAGLSERQPTLRGPCLQLLKAMGMSSANGRFASSCNTLPVLQSAFESIQWTVKACPVQAQISPVNAHAKPNQKENQLLWQSTAQCSHKPDSTC